MQLNVLIGIIVEIINKFYYLIQKKGVLTIVERKRYVRCVAVTSAVSMMIAFSGSYAHASDGTEALMATLGNANQMCNASVNSMKYECEMKVHNLEEIARLTKTNARVESTCNEFGFKEISIKQVDDSYNPQKIVVDDWDMLYRLVQAESFGPSQDVKDLEAAGLVAQSIRDNMIDQGNNSVSYISKRLKYAQNLVYEPSDTAKEAVDIVFKEGDM